ncbi:MAG: hypothetical protein AB1730_05225 [Myxococcota bacterium]
MWRSRPVEPPPPDDDERRGLGASWWRTRWQYTWEPPQAKVRLLDAARLSPGG